MHNELITQECTYQAKWAIRKDGYKLILSRGKKDIHKLPPVELYNLNEDPLEQRNIAYQKKIADKLREKLEKWIEKMVKKNGLKDDPLKTTIPPLGKNWKKFVNKYGYW